MSIWKITLLSATLALTACVNVELHRDNELKLRSAGYTGCMPQDNEIAISKSEEFAGGELWTATCKGKVFLCTATSDGGKHSMETHCAPAVP